MSSRADAPARAMQRDGPMQFEPPSRDLRATLAHFESSTAPLAQTTPLGLAPALALCAARGVASDLAAMLDAPTGLDAPDANDAIPLARELLDACAELVHAIGDAPALDEHLAACARAATATLTPHLRAALRDARLISGGVSDSRTPRAPLRTEPREVAWE